MHSILLLISMDKEKEVVSLNDSCTHFEATSFYIDYILI